MATTRQSDVKKGNSGNADESFPDEKPLRPPPKRKNANGVKKGFSLFRGMRLFILYGMGFVGFHIVVTMVVDMGLMGHSRIVTVPYRAAFLLGALLIFLHGLFSNRMVKLWHPALLMVFVFWFLYLIRVLHSGFANVSLGTPWTDYLIKSFGIVVLPMFAFLVPLDAKENQTARRMLLVTSVIAAVVLLYAYGNYLGASYRSLHIDPYYRVSPHTVSEVGALATILGLYFLLIARKPPMRIYATAIASVSLGLGMMLWGGSRYPSLSVACVFPICLIYSKYRTRPALAFLYTLLVCVVGLVVMWWASQYVGSQLFARFEDLWERLASGDPYAGSGRLQMWASGWHDFLNSPFLGSGLEERYSRYVVHNRYLEGYMATGIIGGTCLLASAGYGVFVALRILKYYPSCGWLSIVFLYRFFTGWMSSYVFDPIYWYTLVALISVYLWHDQGAETRLRKKRRVY